MIMNLILQKLLDNAKNKTDNTSSPPFLMDIRAESQNRPLPNDLQEQQDIPYGNPDTAFLSGDVVYPKNNAATKLPVFIFVHGGALVIGDRKSNRVFCQEIARRGFVVYSVEYRLIDHADAFGMLSDLSFAFKMVKDTLPRFGGDPDRVSLCGESAGAFLSLYAAAATRSKGLRRMLGCEQPGLNISHLILLSGMIYTTGFDSISLVYKKTLYGDRCKNRTFLKRLSPNNPNLLALLPPVYLVSSKADFLRGHTLHFSAALKNSSHPHKLMYYSQGKELTHAFPSLLPSLPESTEVIDAIMDWLNT